MTANISFYIGNYIAIDFPVGTAIKGRGIKHVDDRSGASTYLLTPSAVASLRAKGWEIRSNA